MVRILTQPFMTDAHTAFRQVDLENLLEQEQEHIVNKLQKKVDDLQSQVDTLSSEKALLEQQLEVKKNKRGE